MNKNIYHLQLLVTSHITYWIIMSQKHALVDALKQALKENRITYEDIAEKLDLSHGSIKRIFSNRDFTLERLEQICGMMSLEISDLLLIMQRNSIETTSLTMDQEKELVGDVKLLLTIHLLINNWMVDEILKAYEIQSLDMVKYLAKLDRMKIIDLLPGNRVKLKFSRDFRWIVKGPIEIFFKKHVQDDFLNSDFSNDGEIRLFSSGMISRAANAELIGKIKKLINTFEETHREEESISLTEKFGTSMVVAMRPWDINLFEQHRRPGTYSKF